MKFHQYRLFFYNLITCCLLISSVKADNGANNSQELRPYHIEYTVFIKGSEYGTAKRTLLQVEDTLWYLETRTNISWFILSDTRTEKSWFKVYQDHVLPLQYQQKREGTGPDYLSFILFDHRLKKLKEVGDYNQFSAHYKTGLLDGASYQFQMSRDIANGATDMQYPIIMKGKNRDYRYKVIGHEQLSTPMGKIATIKLERVRNNSKRKTQVWLAQDYAYAVARIWQSKEGEEQADLIINSFKWLKPTAMPALKKQLR